MTIGTEKQPVAIIQTRFDHQPIHVLHVKGFICIGLLILPPVIHDESLSVISSVNRSWSMTTTKKICISRQFSIILI